LKTTRVSVAKWIDKALQMGVKEGMKDTPHKPREAVITDDAKAWVVHLACSKPKDLGYAAELWTRSALARHVRKQAVQAGYPALAKAAKATVQRILAAQTLQPHKVKYYLERRDPLFEQKMRDVLLVYQEVAMQNEALNSKAVSPLEVITVSVDEKPGVQAIGATSPDLAPVAGKHPTVARDPEYKRFGTWSILARWICMTGMSRRGWKNGTEARSSSVAEGSGCLLSSRLHHSHHPRQSLAHTSRETRAYLATRPNRFKYVHTPTHGSWLNIVETLFGKMARTFLRHIRVQSRQELPQRILKGVAEINEEPVVHR